MFEGSGVNEVGIDPASGKMLACVNPAYFRPAEVDLLVGDYTYAKSKLGWQPTVMVESLCQMMVESDIRRNVEANK